MSPEMEAECGSYCFKSIRLILDHTMVLQKQVDGYNEIETTRTLEVLQSVENRLKNEDEKYDNLSRTLNNTLMTHIADITKSFAESFNKMKSEDLGGTTIIRKNTPGKIFNKIGSKFYYIEQNEKVNWFEAVHKCLALGAHLVSIQSQVEMNGLLPQLKASENYWIDINDLGTEGNFLSIVNGLPPTFVNWHSGNPSNSNNNEDCGELHSYNNQFRMNDNNCVKYQLYICESAN